MTVHVANVPKEYMGKIDSSKTASTSSFYEVMPNFLFVTSELYTPGSPVVLFALLEHEHKMSLCNFLLQRTPNDSRPIRNKEVMTFQVGYRRFTASPIYSQHTNGDKHKVRQDKNTHLYFIDLKCMYDSVIFE